MAERTTVTLSKISTRIDMLEKGNKEIKAIGSKLTSVEAAVSQLHDNYQHLLKEFLDLKKTVCEDRKGRHSMPDISNLQESINQYDAVQQQMSGQLQEIQDQVREHDSKLGDQSEQIREHDSKLDDQSVLMMQQELAWKSQVKFSAQMQAKITNDEFVIGGVSVVNGDVMGSVDRFFAVNLKLSFDRAEIKSAYSRGRTFTKVNKDGKQITVPPQIVAKVSDALRSQIMKKKASLKGQINRDLGCGMYINPNQPAMVKAARNRQAPIISRIFKQNEGLPAHQQKQVRVAGMDLYVDSVLHTEEVEAPLRASILRIPVEKVNVLHQIKFLESPDIRMQGSFFKAYILHVESEKEVQNAYLKMRKLEIGAKHVVMMYSIQGPPYKQGYDDDNEPGAAYPLLQILKKSPVKNAALFVARHYTYDIGDVRFSCYRDAVNLAIAELEKQDKE